jgi:hypothetical protein
MADKKPITSTTSTATKPAATGAAVKKETVTNKKSQLPLFEKENYTWMIIGAAIIGLGFILMSGGKNNDANQFDYNVVYSATRITVAPILILIGLGVEIFAIFKRPKARQHQ